MIAYLCRRQTVLRQPALFTGKIGGKGRRCAAGRVAGAGFQEYSAIAAERGLLESWSNGSATDSLLGEQICGTEEYADADAPLDQGGRHGGDHRR